MFKGFQGRCPQKGSFAAAEIARKQSGYLFALLATFSPVLRSDASVLPCIGNFFLNTSPDALCFFEYSYIMYHVEYYPCGGAV